ncbi:MAG: hypothetical protein HY204_00915 [Nitrospirae bacterium]|nr:hypothetical protein [Nitrospirota bacterium]
MTNTDIGVAVTFILGIGNLLYTWTASKRAVYVNTVTSERVKRIDKIRENVATLCSLCDQWMLHRTQDSTPNLQQQIVRAKNEVRLHLNPDDPEDRDIERLLERLPSWTNSMAPEEYWKLQAILVSATQTKLKCEWEKVKDEAVRGNLPTRKER